MIQVEGIFTGGGVTSAPIMGTDFTWTGGDNTCMVLDDGDGNWRIKFLSSGIFTPLKNMVIDVFLVGGGGPGEGGTRPASSYCGGGGGGGGYTTTVRSIVLSANTAWSIVVGEGGAVNTVSGGDTTAFGATASGGKAPTATVDWRYGGNGGSGGGMANGYTGGSDGSDGGSGSGTFAGKGQGTTTREFGETDGDLYAGGGGGGKGSEYASGANTTHAGGAGGGGASASSALDATPGEDGKGGGGGGGCTYAKNSKEGAPGGSGICIIRNHREEAAA